MRARAQFVNKRCFWLPFDTTDVSKAGVTFVKLAEGFYEYFGVGVGISSDEC